MLNKGKKRKHTFWTFDRQLPGWGAPKCLSITKALALKLGLELSERKYNILRITINVVVNNNLFPCLYSLNKGKHLFLVKSI